MERFCRECSAPLAGRSDKHFCSDSCRTAYHNRRYRKEERDTGAVNVVLRRNRRILSAVYKSGLNHIKLTDSRMKGYDRNYFTSVRRRLLRPAVYHCYEYSYTIRGGSIVNLAKTT